MDDQNFKNLPTKKLEIICDPDICMILIQAIHEILFLISASSSGTQRCQGY